MILSFKTELNGSPTCFREKILVHLGKDAILKYFNSTDELSQQVAHEGLAWIKPKKLTIRDDPNNRWQKGRLIHFATGARTKKYECFALGKCNKTSTIVFAHNKEANQILVFLEGLDLTDSQVRQLAQDDGFEDVYAFLAFHLGKNAFVTKKIIYF